MVKESFAYNCIRSKDAKIGTPNAHSLWENVCRMSPNVAGVYIPFNKFFGNGGGPYNNEVTVKMDLIIPFTDQLVLQAWRLYPNRILGELEEEIKCSVEGLVWCQIQPKVVIENEKFWQGNSKFLHHDVPILPITNHFTQINQTAIITQGCILHANQNVGKTPDNDAMHYYQYVLDTTNADKTAFVDYTLKPHKLTCSDLTIKKCLTNCAGFGIKPDVMTGILDGMHEPVIIPAQELSRFQFEGRAGDGTLTMSKSIPLRNATNITIMFPKHTNDCTVFQNVMYNDVRLMVNKKLYPETSFDNTYDGRFVQYQLMANELDDLEPTDEFLESISRPLNNPETGARLITTPFDNTSFGINFQLERGNSGYVFDGIDTGSHAVTIEFKGTREFGTGGGEERLKNSYLYPDITTTDHGKTLKVKEIDNPSPPLPELWVCSDTYWTWSVDDGVKYYQRGIPAGYD